MQTGKRITIGILAHVDAGKTTLSEAILYRTGELRKLGRVDHGDAFLDDSEIERNRGITVFSRQARFTIRGAEGTGGAGSNVAAAPGGTGSTAAAAPGGIASNAAAAADGAPQSSPDTEVTLIDTPGHVDFAAEMERALSVIDYALLVVSGSEGVQAHTRTLYRMLSDRGIPVFVFVNKMDIAVRKKEDILAELAAELGCGAVDFSPITKAATDSSRTNPGIRTSADTGSAAAHIFSIERFIDGITLYSPELAEMVLEHELEAEDAAGDEDPLWIPADADIAEAVRRCEIVPCLFGSALRIEGVDELIETLGRYTLMPQYAQHGAEPAAKVYKVANAEDGSRLTFVKVTGGTFRVRDTVPVRRGASAGNSASGNRNAVVGNSAGGSVSGDSNASGSGGRENTFVSEDAGKINQIRLYSGSRFTAVDEAPAGTVCALTGLSGILPGDALGAGEPESESVIKAFMVYTVEGPEGMDPYLVMKDLEKLAQEDPALSVRLRRETGEIEIRLMGQVQLEVLTTLIRDRYGYDVTFGSGQVLYLETVTEAFEGVGHFEPLRHYAEVHLIVEPGERGSGVVISSMTPEDELARNWQRLILTHIDEKEHIGVLTGAPLTDVRITLAAGRAHDKHTSGGDFREATYRAVRNALMQARSAGKTVLLEPWSEYEIELPSQVVGRAMTDIRQMGGTQEGLDQNGETSRIRGKVPASEIAGYQQTLTSYTAGLGGLACTPAGYAECHDAEAVIEASGYDPERDTDNPADSVFVSHGGSDIVKWDKVPEHMHIGSVLRKLKARAAGIYGDPAGYGGAAGGSDHSTGFYSTGDRDFAAGGRILRGEEKDRRIAAEKELRLIFERTYGPVKSSLRREARESRYGAYEEPEKSPEQKAADEARNRQIREKHEKKRTQTQQQERPVVLIDGYNLIYSDEYLHDLSKKDMGAARDQLLERLCNYAAYTGTETIVVFDAYNVSGGEGYEEDHLGVRVIYTAEDEPADIRIGLITNGLKGRTAYVVSSDVLVQQDSFEHGALRISSREFLALLARTEEEIRAALM